MCLVVPVITRPGELDPWWAPVVMVALISYYALWARYLHSGRAWVELYRPTLAVPVPMAVAPVVAFLAAAAWLSNPWIAAAAVVLAAGHIPAAVLIARAATSR
ncbi:hypothetical protein [Aeromicrobium endophyticum]|nr:hypothetical protein [Aeromicrobium endophyticum]